MKRSDRATEVARVIDDAGSIFISCHEQPDGDAVGSLIALRSMLVGLGKRVHAAAPDPPPSRFDYLDGIDELADGPPPFRPDLGIALDCDGSARLGGLEAALLAADTVVDIDHHRSESAFGDVRYVDDDAASTACLVARIADALDLSLTPSQATALYTGLIADTGGFRFANTTPEALRLGADLVAAGADPEDVARRIFSSRPLSAARLEARALSSLHMLDGGLLIASLSRDDFIETGAHPSDTDGVIDSFRDVTGARVAVLMKETEPDEWHVSMRGNGVDVASIAVRFGGGGHTFAAGCTLTGDRDEVRRRLTQSLREAVADAGADT